LGVIAYTLIRTSRHKIKELANRIEKLLFVKEVTPVYGEYDIVIKTETESIRELNLFIYNHLRTMPGITMTTTMITAKIDKTSVENSSSSQVSG